MAFKMYNHWANWSCQWVRCSSDPKWKACWTHLTVKDLPHLSPLLFPESKGPSRVSTPSWTTDFSRSLLVLGSYGDWPDWFYCYGYSCKFHFWHGWYFYFSILNSKVSVLWCLWRWEGFQWQLGSQLPCISSLHRRWPSLSRPPLAVDCTCPQ